MVMAERRKGVLVTSEDDGSLLGILTPKDLLNRVISKQLSPEDTTVMDVMTPNPDCVSPDVTLLDALREMHDHKYLHLPVRDDEGVVHGVVDVMELLCHTAGDASSGGKGWRDFFACAGDGLDDMSDTASQRSAGSKTSKTSKTSSGASSGWAKSGVDSKPVVISEDGAPLAEALDRFMRSLRRSKVQG